MEHNRKPDWKCGCWDIWLSVCDVRENQHILKCVSSGAQQKLVLSCHDGAELRGSHGLMDKALDL